VKAFTINIADAELIIHGLQEEIRRSEESRYVHRLHAVLLVAQGMTCPEVAGLLRCAPRTVEYWVRSFEKKGLSGLLERERPGRPKRLNENQLQAVRKVLREAPREAGVSGSIWDGKTLSAWIEQQYGIKLGVRQCQRIFAQLDFRLCKAASGPPWPPAHELTRKTGTDKTRRRSAPTVRNYFRRAV
jgi:transposase